MELPFVKMHGLGNDFVVIDDRSEELDLSPAAVEWFCDRNFGIGADGLMLVQPARSPAADYSWWFRNSDGSVAEMCGNGIRCFVKYLVDRGLVPVDQDVVRVDTAVGVLSVEVSRGETGKLELATVDMGEPVLDPAIVPTTLTPIQGEFFVGVPLETTQGTFEVTCVSMGNPHCVLFVEDVESAPVGEIGPLIEAHPAFPRKTNVEFAQVMDAATIRLRVWERGVGETLACGTGACATVVAASLNGLCGDQVTVELLGGVLQIRLAANGRVFMTGPAEEVFSGTMLITEDDGEDEEAEPV